MANDDLLDIVPTRAMLQKRVKSKDFKATVFDPKLGKLPKSEFRPGPPERRSAPDSDDDLLGDEFGGDDDDFPSRRKPKRTPIDETVFDMKRARHEVIRFGTSGFETEDKKRAQIALAVKLGAKPPKKEYKNYKEMVAEKKKQNEAKESRQRMLQLGKNQMGVATVRCQPNKGRKKGLGDISEHYGVAKPKVFKKKKRRN